MNTEAGVILPDRPRETEPEEFYNKEKKYPVLWLLHGAMGDYSDWVRKSNIERYACDRDLIVVMPSGYNSYYGSWPHYSGGLYAENFIINELMPMIYAWFPASAEKKDNFIGGLSMGGQGTIQLCARYPEKFMAGAALSASAIEYKSKYMEEKDKSVHPHADYVDANGGLETFLESGLYTRKVLEDMYKAGKINQMPFLYMESGGGDARLGEFEETAEFLKKLGIETGFSTVGNYGHEWDYWDIGIRNALAFFERFNADIKVKEK